MKKANMMHQKVTNTKFYLDKEKRKDHVNFKLNYS